jgi:septum site-determining protein MinD
VAVALNRGSDDAPTETIADRLGAPVTVVPEDPAVARAQAAGQPVAALAPRSRAATALAALAETVARTTTPAARRYSS